MSQPAITSFFSSRKRAAVDDLTSIRSKVLVLDDQDEDQEVSMKELEKLSKLTPKPVHSTLRGVKLLSNKKDNLKIETKVIPKTQSKAVTKLTFDGQTDESSKTVFSKVESLKSDQNEHGGLVKKPLVPFKKCGNLSPVKRKTALEDQGSKKTAFTSKHKQVSNALNNRLNIQNDTASASDSAKLVALKNARKELSLGDIKKNLLQSPRLNELRARVSSLRNGFNKLEEYEKTRIFGHGGISDAVPKILDMNQADVLLSPLTSPTKISNENTDETTSPVKEPLMSPRKSNSSPVKSPSKVPAYIRHASLVDAKSALHLPHHYRFLGEVFRALDTVASMLHNRGESVTFAKVKPAVQEMLRRNLTEKQLEQIKYLCPEMYTFSREKMRNAGFTSKQDTYELFIKPELENGEKTMGPNALLARRRKFFDKLINAVKDHHDKFLISLDPPMQIRREKLMRWHPEFEIEKIPDIEVEKLPQALNAEIYSTARDVLARARQLFNCNSRMEKALERLAENRKEKEREEVVSTGETSNSTSSTGVQTNVTNCTKDNTLLNPALKGVPKALLEKIKAKQAAKAIEAMTRTSAKEKNILVYQRLPDLARVLRNLYVTEKKSILPLDTVISKLDNSFRSKMSHADMKEQLKALADSVPRFLTFHDIRNGIYLRLEKTTNLNEVIDRLQKLSGDI